MHIVPPRRAVAKKKTSRKLSGTFPTFTFDTSKKERTARKPRGLADNLVTETQEAVDATAVMQVTADRDITQTRSTCSTSETATIRMRDWRFEQLFLSAHDSAMRTCVSSKSARQHSMVAYKIFSIRGSPSRGRVVK